jgi:hypothetical protein
MFLKNNKKQVLPKYLISLKLYTLDYTILKVMSNDIFFFLPFFQINDIQYCKML